LSEPDTSDDGSEWRRSDRRRPKFTAEELREILLRDLLRSRSRRKRRCVSTRSDSSVERCRDESDRENRKRISYEELVAKVEKLENEKKEALQITEAIERRNRWKTESSDSDSDSDSD